MYYVLLILTDGQIHDVRQTIDSIVELSGEPLSVIIVGVGDADFSAMDFLDCDEGELVDGNLVPASRDIVQFVKMRDFKQYQDPAKLAEAILAEIPD